MFVYIRYFEYFLSSLVIANTFSISPSLRARQGVAIHTTQTSTQAHNGLLHSVRNDKKTSLRARQGAAIHITQAGSTKYTTDIPK